MAGAHDNKAGKQTFPRAAAIRKTPIPTNVLGLTQ